MSSEKSRSFIQRLVPLRSTVAFYSPTPRLSGTQINKNVRKAE